MVVRRVRIQGVHERPDGEAEKGGHHRVEGHIIETDVHCGGQRDFEIVVKREFDPLFWCISTNIVREINDNSKYCRVKKQQYKYVQHMQRAVSTRHDESYMVMAALRLFLSITLYIL